MAKQLSRYLLTMLVILAVAGVAVIVRFVSLPPDIPFLHLLFEGIPPGMPLLHLLSEIVDDGGEVMVMSDIVWLVALFLWCTGYSAVSEQAAK